MKTHPHPLPVNVAKSLQHGDEFMLDRLSPLFQGPFVVRRSDEISQNERGSVISLGHDNLKAVLKIGAK